MTKMSKATIYGIAIFLVMLFTGIGYAFLSSNLSINGTATVSKKKNVICKRATSLHREKCLNENTASKGYGCLGEGYSINSDITYGKLGTNGVLSPGDAFDCDVNGDGTYSATEERFYYVTDLDSDDSYAVLIFFSNGGQVPKVGYVLDDIKENLDGFTFRPNYSTSNNPLVNGPNNVTNHLPSTDNWPNVRLSNVTRTIKDEIGKEYLNFTYITGVKTPAARLITHNEIIKACPTINDKQKIVKGRCEYLVENTGYAFQTYDNSKGYWGESVYPAKDDLGESLNKAWAIDGWGHCTYPTTYDADGLNSFGARPVIEVKKGQIEY